MASNYLELIECIKKGTLVPYLGPGVLQGISNVDSGEAIPADSDSLILAMTGGQPMAPRLMYEFPRAAMHMENKKGRTFLENFLQKTYGECQWSASPFHSWLAELNCPYAIDINRDSFLQHAYSTRAHTLVVGVARLAAHPYRFDLYEFNNGQYKTVELDTVNRSLPVLFKPLGTPLPKPSFIASDADFVDYITELMGGFAIPSWLKDYRKEKRYLFLGMRFTRDTERMVMSDIIYAADECAGWAFIPEPTDKEQRFLAKKNIEIINDDWTSLVNLKQIDAA